MNILEIHGQSSLFGGASVHTSMLVDYFAEREGEIIIVYQKGNEILKNYKFSSRVHVYEFDFSNILLLPIVVWRISRLVKLYKVDIIHSHHRKADFIASIIRFFNKKIKVISTIHGRFNDGTNEHKIKYRLFNKITVFLMNLFLDKIVFISKYTMMVNQDYFSKSKRKCVIYNGSKKLSLSKSLRETRRVLGLDEGCFVVTLLCVMSGRKRPDILLRIANYFKGDRNIIFLFVGDGDLVPSLRGYAEENGINALFLGYREDVGDIIQASNIIVSTAIHEGFGRTLTEAMMLSKPVIAFRADGPSEIIQDGKCGYLIEEGDINGYVDAIMKIYSDKNLENRLGSGAEKVAKENFSDEVFCNNYEKLFAKTLKDNTCP